MNYEAQLKLQSFLDGELSEGDAREVAAWVARDPQAAALLAELRHTRESVAGFEKMFACRKAVNSIGPKSSARSPVLSHRGRRRLRLSHSGRTCAAWQSGNRPGASRNRWICGQPRAERRWRGGVTEFSVSDAEALTYRDYSAGTTLVWLSYPAENEVAQNNPRIHCPKVNDELPCYSARPACRVVLPFSVDCPCPNSSGRRREAGGVFDLGHRRRRNRQTPNTSRSTMNCWKS